MSELASPDGGGELQQARTLGRMNESDWLDCPPLDISVVARHVAFIMSEVLDTAARDMKEAFRRGFPIEGIDLRVPLNAERSTYDKVVELLRQYDEGRTRHIAFLKGELIRLHSLMPSTPFMIKTPATEEKRQS